MRDIGNKGPSMEMAQSGEAKAMIRGIHSYEQTQETLALLLRRLVGAG